GGAAAPVARVRIVEPREAALLATREVEVTASVEGGVETDRPTFSGGPPGGPASPGSFRGISGGSDVRAATGTVTLPEGAAEVLVSFPGAEEARVRVRVDTTPPALVPDSGPGEESPTREAAIRISGSVADASEVSVAVAGSPTPVSGGRFEADAALREGRNELVVVARDAAGHETRRTVERWRDSRPPAIRAIPPAPLEWRAGLAAWIAVEADEPLAAVEAGGLPGEVSGIRGSVQVPVAGPGEHRFRVVARDRAGNEATAEVAIEVRAPASTGRTGTDRGPDPEEALAEDLRRAEGHADRTAAIASLRAFLARGPPPGLAKRARARLEALEADAAREASASRSTERLSAAESAAAIARDWREKALVWTRFLREEPGNGAARSRLAAVLPAGLRPGEVPGEFVAEADGAVLLLVPGGKARLGSKGGYPEERPPHEADLSPFLLDRECVTVARYARFLEVLRSAKEPHATCHPGEAPGRDHAPDRWREQQRKGDLPVVGVDWFDAFAYAHWVGRELPTEAQWERAASYDPGEATRTYPWGEAAPEGGRANFLAAGRRAPFPAATFVAGASALGILDLSGNVSEWCLDWYDPTFYGRPECHAPDPLNRKPSRSRTVRGGSFQSEPLRLRCASREGLGPHVRSPAVGFRCAK
ncbi:MAG: formylglycine-generating enzyme family protein, partial [Planctomycetales bacterium]|nr:formylglycine-generating enzyme family protein [Planctomycetales bacterium]